MEASLAHHQLNVLTVALVFVARVIVDEFAQLAHTYLPVLAGRNTGMRMVFGEDSGIGEGAIRIKTYTATRNNFTLFFYFELALQTTLFFGVCEHQPAAAWKMAILIFKWHFFLCSNSAHFVIIW